MDETSLAACVEAMTRLHPGVHLNVEHGSEQHPTLDVLRRELADILILPTTTLDEYHVEHVRWSDAYVLVAARSRLLTPRPFHELCEGVRYVSWRHAGVERLHGQLAAAQVRLSHRGELSCVATLLDLVGKGQCMTILPSRLIPDDGGLFECVRLPVQVERSISVIARPGSLLSNAANEVIEVLKRLPVGD
ncbi:LysR family transcriptional regulator substrate-binding protein [Pseudomonas sp. CDFA 553]|uniref:LysR family transcriptional regulator substrate-binding protein n=1 Tax=Pseudomonas quasicaspiana TaxID=2829821 RepID=UPI001E46C0FB|nr:LysR family transcriptional regulator substrate-binding protein [Pseudomonas quasicaspiana]MCD5991539.1 LysR family transcriptional regulator substrate-binding protein [Pseudomonas quasicaspiana]